MVRIDEFIKEEVNETTLRLVLQCIEGGIREGKYKGELIFNRYSLDFDFESRTVIIYDDIFTDEPPLEMSIEELKSVVIHA